MFSHDKRSLEFHWNLIILIYISTIVIHKIKMKHAFIFIYCRTQISIQKAKLAVFPIGNQNPYSFKNSAVFYFCKYKLLIFILQNMQPLFWSKNQMSWKFLIVVSWLDVFRILQEFLSNEQGIRMEYGSWFHSGIPDWQSILW